MGTSVNTNTTAIGATNVPISTEIIAGDALQRIKLVIGALGVDGGDISAANPMPATIAALPLPAGAATETTVATLLTNTQLRATAIPVAGGRANDGTDTAAGNKHLTIGGTDGTNLRPISLDTSGRQNVNITTVDVSPATANVTAQDVGSTTTLVANGQSFITGTPTAGSVAVFSIANLNSCTVQVTATWTGTLSSEISIDGGATWFLRSLHQAGTEFVQRTFTNNFAGGLNSSGYTHYRIRGITAWTGTATVRVVGTRTVNSVFINNALRLTDPTTSTQMLAINAAGAAKTTLSDINGVTALVSPAGSLSVTTEIATASGSITTQNLVPAGAATAGSAVEITLAGASTGTFQVTGTYTGALSLQGTADNANWVTFGGNPIINVNTGGYLATVTSALQSVFQCEIAGFLKVRVTGLAAMTGTAVVTFRAIQGAPAMVSLDAALPAGTAIIGALVANQSTNVAQINGVAPLMGNGTTGTGSPRVTIASDNTAFTVNLGTSGTAATNLGKAEDNAHTSADVGTMALGVRTDVLTTGTGAAGRYGYLALNRFNAALTSDFRQNARTYSAAANVAVAVTATDIFDLFGNATSTVVITKIIITGIQTTAGQIDFLAIKRSTANSVGTRAAMTVVPHDASDSAANSTPGTYTANPTTGTAVGAIRRAYIPITAAATALQGTVEFSFGTTGKGITLSGTAQGLCLNLNGATITGGTFDISVEWYEF